MLSAEEFALLEAIRDAGSLSKAAARLGKAPSTVSYAARQLEERFDALLFDRRRYRLELTPAGRLLAQEAARFAQESARLTQRVKQIAGGWEDRLWLVCDEILDFAAFVPVIQQFDALQSGVSLRLTAEVLGGTWEALRDGRANLVVGATNAPPSIPKLRWFELGVMEWVFAVSPRHALAKASEPIELETLSKHRAVVVADTSRNLQALTYGVAGGQASLAVPRMEAKIRAQLAGLGVGWLPKECTRALIDRGELVAKRVADPREPNTLYVGWRGDQEGRALRWWIDQLQQPRFAARLIQGPEWRG